jgi:hypothetical protein
MLHDLIWGVPNAAMIFAFDVIKQKRRTEEGRTANSFIFPA